MPYNRFSPQDIDTIARMRRDGKSAAEIQVCLQGEHTIESIKGKWRGLGLSGAWRRATDWTEAEENVVRQMHDGGYSSTLIARQLDGRFTRNAVIGKVRRMGLAAKRPKGQPPKFAAKQVHKRHKPAPPINPPLTTPKPLLSLGRGECRYPIDHLYCAAPNCKGSYCDYHAGIVYIRGRVRSSWKPRPASAGKISSAQQPNFAFLHRRQDKSAA